MGQYEDTWPSEDSWTLATSFEQEDPPKRVQPEGLIDICQPAETTSDNNVIKLSVF